MPEIGNNLPFITDINEGIFQFPHMYICLFLFFFCLFVGKIIVIIIESC